MHRDHLALLSMVAYHIGASLGPQHGVAAIVTAFVLVWANERWGPSNR